jgi:uncharacterized membrane protein
MIKTKQISALFMAPIHISGLSFTAGVSATVTAALATAAATAGRGSVAVPVQAMSATTEGFATTSPSNSAQIWSAVTKKKLTDNTPAENEVFGRITQAAGVYTLSTYVLIGGVETSYAIPSTLPIDIEAVYQFSFEHLPADTFIGMETRNVYADGATGAGRTRQERVVVTGVNVLAALSIAYAGAGRVTLDVNGVVHTNLGGGTADFTIAGTAITWSAVNSGYSLVPGDIVDVDYAF